jgi:hypothetical protein
MVTSTFGIVAANEGSPGVGEVYAFMSGAVLGFVAVLAAATRGFRHAAMDAEPTEVLAVAAALSLGSTAAGLGAATLVGHFLGGPLAWGLAPFASSAAFCSCSGSSSASPRSSRTRPTAGARAALAPAVSC